SMNRRLLVLGSVVVAVAALGGYWIGRSAHAPASARSTRPVSQREKQQVYTCSMHPQVRLDRPGPCPICEMPLIPADAPATNTTGEAILQLSDHALAMASVETAIVTRRALTRELHAIGKIQYDESSLATITARVDGYAERLFVNFTGMEIKAGDHLAEVYSPELLVAQQELLIALQNGGDRRASSLVEAAKLKLQRWGLTTEQITALIEKQSFAERVTLHSPIAGTVIEKSIVQNSAFKAGDALYRIANLDTVWVYLDVYEYDLAWVRYGQKVNVSAEALPGRTFSGLVTFVQPIVDEETRTIRVPVHVDNRDHALKPGMFVSAEIESRLDQDGRAAPTGVEGRFTCRMHPEILESGPGTCRVCAMTLEQIPVLEPASVQHGDQAANSEFASGVLAVPATAVLDSGLRQIVFVERERGAFEARPVVLGPRSGAFVAVLSGVAEGERVVTRGGFLIDSQFQITGLPSLFYPGGLMAGATGHRHGAESSTPAPASDAARSSSAPPAPPSPPSQHEH
ncbi:MAG: efflux RND transporter periplasmic adaptor subunit, partial [Thermoanaerobaculia bacterium]